METETESRQLSTSCGVKEDVALESILLACRECSNRVAVSKIDSRKVWPCIANNEVAGILKFNNFPCDEGGVRVWQA